MKYHAPSFRSLGGTLPPILTLVLVSSVQVAKGGVPAAFTEEAVARGIDYYTPARPSLERFGYGLAFVDLDGDRDPDIIVTGQTSNVVGVYENDGNGYFTDRSSGSGIPVLNKRSGVVALDYDADDDLDLYFTQIDEPNVLVRNDGSFSFTDVSAAAGVDDTDRGTGAAVGDYDGDGWLDIYVPNYDGPDHLHRNLGNGTFADVASTLGLADPWRGWQAVFFDMDSDGDADLYVSNDKKVPTETQMRNRLYENVGGVLVDISTNSGTDVNIYSMGIGVGDFDGDGRQDLYCTNLAVEPNSLFLNQGGGLFAQSEVLAGVESYRTGWGAVLFDYDNDGRPDLYVCNMIGPPLDAPPHNRLYVHDGSWPCVDMAPALAVDDSADSFAVAVADIDDDGDLDILVQSNDARIRLYVNHEGQTRRWIKFDLVGQGNNRFAIGAQVRVRTGSVWRLREVIAGGNNFKSQNDLTVHFGVNDALSVDEIVVMWPGGDTRTLTNLESNRTWVVYPPERLGDCDGDGDVDLVDLDELAACLTGPQGNPPEPACGCVDFDGDGGTDLADYSGFQASFTGQTTEQETEPRIVSPAHRLREVSGQPGSWNHAIRSFFHPGRGERKTLFQIQDSRPLLR